MNTPVDPSGKPSPVTVRLDEEHRAILERLALDSNPSEAIRRAIRLAENTRGSGEAPLYPRLIDEDTVVEAIDAATRAACDVLDELFPQPHSAELGGISSNFQGTLAEHLAEMLMGRAHKTYTYRRYLNALLGDEHALGKVRTASSREGYSAVQLPERVTQAALYFDGDRGQFVPLKSLGADQLYTDPKAVVGAVFSWMNEMGVSPRESRIRLCLLNFEADGPLQAVEVAA